MRKKLLLATACLSLTLSASARDYSQVIRDTAAMVSDSAAQGMARAKGLQILNLTWEDTGRYKGSSVGPNISDMTLQIEDQGRLTCLPVIRHPNFEDVTADLKMEDFYLLVGNEKKGAPLERVNLREYLGEFRSHLSQPNSWAGQLDSLLAARDSHVLVSAQACFLPIPKQGEATFNPVLFNYQSSKGNPAVLTILATREGTSATIIDNTRDGFAAGQTWGQRLFFNQHGERASLTGQRVSDFKGQVGPAGTVTANSQKGLNMVMLVQVPLKFKETLRPVPAPCCDSAGGSVMMTKGARSRSSDVEDAVVGHGKVEGPFTEVDGVAIERDPRFPVRVTVQFYKATSNGEVSEKDMADISGQLKQVYANATYVGSLVTEGETKRPTEYDGDKKQPKDWWEKFWQRHQQNTGQSWWDVQNLFAKLNVKSRP